MVESFRGRPYAEKHFRSIVEAARRDNPFYRRWITNPENPPIVDRQTFQENNLEILNRFKPNGSTSGSTGIPVKFSHSEEWLQMAGRDTKRFVTEMGGLLNVVRIVYTPDTPRPDTISINAPLREQIHFILKRRAENNATAVTTFPTNAELLADEVVRRGIDMGFVERFGLYAETVEPQHKEAVRRAFPNARIWTSYSSSEVALIATICPHEPDFHHIRADRLGVEVLRDDDTPAAEGERGRVVVTDYFNTRSPFIRYELGDYAVRGTCPCGKTNLPALRHIYGKTRGALLHRNGERMVFVDLSVSIRSIPGMRQYQVIQDSVEDFTVRVVCDGAVDKGVAQAFAGHFGYVPDNLRVEYVESIPRGPSGKFHASICNV